VPVHLTINPAAPDLHELAPALDALRRGGVIAYPTDTLYGLGADPSDRRAVERVFAIKGRNEQQPIPLIAASLDQAREVGEFDAVAERLAGRFWPGPLTMVVRQVVALADGVGQRGTIAVRVPDHAVARALALGLAFPITSTSANRTGATPAATADDVLATIGNLVDVIVDAGGTRGGSPSTIVDVSGGAPRLVRAGAVPWKRVLESLE
jgi:L-threonylcarbamoyladenylate synthase